MIKREGLKAIENLNVDLLDEAIRQAELKVTDEHNRKDRIDTRVYNLITLNVGALTVISGFIALLGVNGKINSVFLGVPVIVFSVAIYFLVKVLKPFEYGGLGVFPETWLEEELLREENNYKGYVLAHILYDYQETISASDEANRIRIKLLNKALLATLCAVLSLVFFLSVSVIKSFL